MSSSVAVLIPALNEELSLPGVLRGLSRNPVDQASSARGTGDRLAPDPAGAEPFTVDRVVVVDNGSTDRTAEVAADAGATVIREPRRGYGAACLAGIAHLAGLPTPPDVLVFMDADRSDDASALPKLVDPVVRGEADLALGVRSRAVPLHAWLGNGLVLGLVRILFGFRFSDVPPYRAVDFRSLLELDMDDRDWGWTLQMQIRARKRGLRIAEVPVPHRSRVAGRSKISGSLVGSARAGSKMIYTVFRERLLG